MTTTNDQNANIPNAEAIIEKFGGIRPMASKVIVPVTTVQGWKKRNVIPANRQSQIADAASRHAIDLGDLLNIVVTTNVDVAVARPTAPQTMITESVAPPVSANDSPSVAPAKPVIVAPVADKSATPQTTVSPTTAVTTPPRYGRRKSDRYAHAVWLAVMILAIAILVGLLAMGPGVSRIVTQEKRLVAMETQLQQFDDQMKAVKTENAMLMGLVPDNLKSEINGLQDRAKAIESTVSGIGTQAKALVNNVMGSDSGSIEQRLAHVEGEIKRFADLTGSSELTAFVVRLRNMQVTEEGQKALEMAKAQLLGALEAAKPKDNAEIKKTLDNATRTNEALRNTMDGLKGDDLKAAAMLLALGQFRDTLARDKVSFDQDLKIMRDLIGNDNPDLVAAMDRLTPQAKAGVLTPKTLGTQFRGLTGDIIAASLQGEDVSVTERVKARLHEVLKIEHKGEPLTGTPTQQAVDVARAKLDAGDVQGAINVLQALDGKAAEKAAPWVADAEKTLAAQQVSDMFTKTLSARISVQPIAAQLGNLQAAGFNVQALTNGLVQSLSAGLPAGTPPAPYVQNPATGVTIGEPPAKPSAPSLPQVTRSAP